MTENQVIPEAAVEAAARKLFQATMDEPWEVADPEQEADFRERARAILEAAAPHIQAVALKAAAEAAEGMHDPVAPDCREWADWLRARARIGVPTYTAVSE